MCKNTQNIKNVQKIIEIVLKMDYSESTKTIK